jgi:SdrD B-like domain
LSRYHLRRFAALAVAGALGGLVLGVPGIAAADTTNSSCANETPFQGAPATDQPFRLCASFDKTAYRSSEIIKLTISITNTGTGTALQVFMDAPLGGPGYRMLNPESGIFGGPGAAVNIPAGQTYTFEQDGYAADPASGTVTYSGEVVQGTGQVLRSYPDPVNISASVTPVTGSYGGTVFADDNANGQQDPGEHGLPGVKVTLNGPFGGLGTSTGSTDFPATTDAQGHFQLDNLAGGQYIVQVTGVPDGSVVHSPSNQGIVLVDGSPGQTSELYPVVPQLSNTLHATMSFDQSSYHVGQSAHLTVTLQNTGTTPITGIQAGCDHVGDANQVMGLGNGWEVLRGAGVTVNPGQTTTLHLSELVMADSGAEGMFFAECVFGPDAINGDFTGYPDPNASVKALPALSSTSTVALKLIDDDPVGPVVQAGTLLLDPATQDPVSWRLSTPATFDAIPTGTYELQILGNWKRAPGETGILHNPTDLKNGQWTVHVLPASFPQPPPTAPPTTTTTPPSTTTTTPAAGDTTTTGGGQPLPFTGAYNVVGFTIAALTLLAAGTAAILFTKRRKATR